MSTREMVSYPEGAWWALELVRADLAPALDPLGELRGRSTRFRPLHQRPTEEVGHPKLKEHLGAVVAIMNGYDDEDRDELH